MEKAEVVSRSLISRFNLNDPGALPHCCDSNSPKNAANRSGRASVGESHAWASSITARERRLYRLVALDATRTQTCDAATRATFSHQKIAPFPADPLVDDAACDDAGGGSVTDAHFRVQSNSDFGDKQEGGGER